MSNNRFRKKVRDRHRNSSQDHIQSSNRKRSAIPLINLEDGEELFTTPPSKRAHCSDSAGPSRTVLKPKLKSQTTGGLASNSKQSTIPSSVDNQMFDYYHTSKQSLETYQSKLTLVEDLYKVLVPHFPNCGLYLVGSSINGFGSCSSDVDMCLMVQENKVSWKMSIDFLIRIQSILRSSMPTLKRTSLIRANVPILQFYDSISGKECDMNINNDVGIRNSHLLRCYCKYDNRVAPLVMFIKKWAKFQNINSAKDKTISSYVLTLMVIHYLQVGVPGRPVLPCLQITHKHLFKENIRELDMFMEFNSQTDVQHSRIPIGQLFHGFLGYYGNQFKFSRDVASIRTGRKLHINSVRSESYSINSVKDQNSWLNAQLFVEEPFSRTNAARSVYDQHVFRRIQRVFSRSHQLLGNTQNLNSIITTPL